MIKRLPWTLAICWLACAGARPAASNDEALNCKPGEVTRPVLLSGKDIVYTHEAIAACAEGVMTVKCTFGADGYLRSCQIIKSLPYLEKAMLDALATRRTDRSHARAS